MSLAFLGIAIDFGHDYFATAPVRVFDSLGVGNVAVTYLAFALFCCLITRLQNLPGSFIGLMVMPLAAAPTVLAGYIFVAETTEMPAWSRDWAAWVGYFLYLAWWFAIIFRAVHQLYGAGLVRKLSMVVIYAAVTVSPEWLLPLSQFGFWYTKRPSISSAQTRRPRIDIERTYYAQRSLLNKAIDKIRPDRPGVIDIYFVGFAGYARQDVFLREVRSVNELFNNRFDTADRSLMLINNPKTVNRVPLANIHNLGFALRDIAKRMNKEDDMLFLFITSHGSKDHLSVRFWPLGLIDISPKVLRGILDRSGIKWRVIVVSACYSGGFIDALKDENTLIVTAARRDRTSFGCGNENEFT